MQICTICNSEKDESQYAFRNKAKGILHARCKDCVSKIDRQRYLSLSVEDLHDRKEKTKSAVIDVKRQVYNYLSCHPCVDCGETNPVVLEFDHIDPSTKIGSICYLAGKWSWNSLLTEINKCEVRCANCHRIKTAKQFNYYSYIHE